MGRVSRSNRIKNRLPAIDSAPLLRLKRRTTYIIERIRQAQYEGLTMEQEMERRERERCEWCKRELSAGMERMEEGVNAASLRPEWQRVDSTSRLRNGRKFHS